MKDIKQEIDIILTEFNFDRLSFDEAKERLFSLLHPPQTDEVCRFMKKCKFYQEYH